MTADEIKALRERANSVLAHPREIQPVAVLEPKQLLALLTIAERAEGLRAAAALMLQEADRAGLGSFAYQIHPEIYDAIRAALAAFGETPDAQ